MSAPQVTSRPIAATDTPADDAPLTIRRGDPINRAGWLKPPPADAPQPSFVCTVRRVDAGDVWTGQRVTFGWEVTNAGEVPLRIWTQYGGIFPLGPVGWTVAPGKTEFLAYWAGGGESPKWGPLSTVVYTNDRKNPQVILEVSRRVRRAIRVDCGSGDRPRGCDLGRFPRSAGPATGIITITRGDGGPIRPTVIGFDRLGPIAELRTVEAGERYELQVTVPSELAPYPDYYNSILLQTGIVAQPEDKISFGLHFDP